MDSCDPSVSCDDLQAALELLGDRWSMIILWNVKEGPKRFGEIQKASEGINTRTLTQRLQKLEEWNLITKCEYKEYPPRTEYAITERGQELEPVFQSMMAWAQKHLSQKTE